MVERSLVSVVDDDESVRESLPGLIKEFGYAAQAFSSAEAFLASDYVGQTRCLILDIAMPPGHVWTRSPTATEPSRAGDSDRLHYGSRR
jgi:FixJ family two-component response regulator